MSRKAEKGQSNMFTGFPEETLQFFLDLRFHNNHAYFHEQHDRYQQDVRQPFYDFIAELAPYMLDIDPQMEVRPHKCLARIHRDTRFSNDKSPYRDHLWLLFRRAAEPREGSVNFYFELGPGRLGWGMGTWGEYKPGIEVFRRKIEANPRGVKDIIDDCALSEHHLVVGGRSYKRMEIPPSVPPYMQDWYKVRELFIGREDTQMSWISDASLVDRVRRDFEALAPLYRLLRGAWDEANV